MKQMKHTKTFTYLFRKFQEFNGFPVTGIMNRETYEQMTKPRCGFRDILEDADPDQPLSYTHLGENVLHFVVFDLVTFLPATSVISPDIYKYCKMFCLHVMV